MGRKGYSPEEKQALLQRFVDRPAEVSVKEMVKRLGVSNVTLYKWKSEQNGQEALPVPKDGMIPLAFNVVQDKEAQGWIKACYRGGRFMAFKAELVRQLQGLRKKQALTFAGPANKDKKECRALYSVAHGTLRKQGLPFRVSYDAQRNLFIVTRKEAV